MNDSKLTRRKVLKAGGVASAATLLSASGHTKTQATPSDKDSLVGTWDMTDWRAELPSGEIVHPLGDDAKGSINYGEEDRMSFMMMQSGRPLFESGDPLIGTDDEIKAAYTGFMAYSGRYTLDSKKQHITHFLDICWFPNWVGHELTREYEIDGDRLILRTISHASTGSDLAAARQVLEWRRAQDIHSQMN